MSGNNGPTLAGFNAFVTNIMQISPLVLPPNSPIIEYAYNVAFMIANPILAAAGCPPNGQWSIYALAVYNLGGSNLVNFAQDQEGRTYFAELRERLGIAVFTPGVTASSGDAGTSEALLNPEFMRTLTLQNLQSIKDPWGRQYLMFAQSWGPLWGLT